jgi:hypothetical protein
MAGTAYGRKIWLFVVVGGSLIMGGVVETMDELRYTGN